MTFSTSHADSVPIRKIRGGRRAQPVRHFVLQLSDEEHARLRNASRRMRGFSHAFIRFPDDGETIVQGRDYARIEADIRAIFPDICIERRAPGPGDYIFDH